MGRLKIVAPGKNSGAQSNARGRLFEGLMASVLRHLGYSIERAANVNYAGMEIDIEGRQLATNLPLYAECKAYGSPVDSPKFQAFFGKYQARWHKDNRSIGLFIALPGVNSHAKGFYLENCESATNFTIRLLQEEDVLEALFITRIIPRPEDIARQIAVHLGTPGDWVVLVTPRGLYWVQYILPPGSGFARQVTYFDSTGRPISDRESLDYLIQVEPELTAFEVVELAYASIVQHASVPQDADEIVEVRGSSTYFEYQFPASPQFFIGRTPVLDELDGFLQDLLAKRVSARGILFEAASGWGKSSVVLASVNRLQSQGHYALAIDSRSASSSQFILRVADYIAQYLGSQDHELSELSKSQQVSGFDGAIDTVIRFGRLLERRNQVLFVFLDQFENVFFLPEALQRIHDLLLKLCDVQTNVVIGFAWKSDLVGITSEFPYRARDTLAGSSKKIILKTFSDVETNALLGKLEQELRSKLRKDLSFFLSQFSQGYPWLLKKLCAHVKAQRDSGVPQVEIANNLLNVEELFQQDLNGLSPEEEDHLRRIAKLAPISINEFGDDFQSSVVQSLVNRRLLVRIGNKFDVYWDIFRDYVNTGRLPIQENYILRMQVGSVSRVVKLLVEANGSLSVEEFKSRAGLVEKSYFNVVKDMRLLGLGMVEDGQVTLRVVQPDREELFEEWFRANLRERLRRNRLVSGILVELESHNSLTIDDVAEHLASQNPYISAAPQTWRKYAHTFADWMDAADLAIFESTKGRIRLYQPRTEVLARRILPSRGRSSVMIPRIQYTPVERVAIRLVEALEPDSRMDWTGFRPSTVSKALLTLEELGFISRKQQSIEVLPQAIEFVRYPDRRAELIGQGAMQLKAFAAFVRVLEENAESGLSLGELGAKLREVLGTDWADGTAETNAKIMLDWSRHTGLAPGVFAFEKRNSMRRDQKRRARISSGQKTFLTTID